MIDLVVTRHPGLVAYLRELGLATEATQVISHASPEAVRGKHVCGVLPHSLSCLCERFTEVPLALPAELRGAELTLEQVRQYASAPVSYIVKHTKRPESRSRCPVCGSFFVGSVIRTGDICPACDRGRLEVHHG